jgi:hypothetical protein
MLAFTIGLKVLAGVDDDEINRWEEHIRLKESSGDPFGGPYWDWGMRIEGVWSRSVREPEPCCGSSRAD